MEYILGLDLGISSVGWAVLDPGGKELADLGVRAFTAAENPKTKSPLAEPRRLARSARRRTRRRAERLRRIKDLFVAQGLVAETARDAAFLTAPDKPCPWQLRAEGLDRSLKGEELARALFHLARRRGYQSNSRLEAPKADDKEEKGVLTGIEANTRLRDSEGYRTAGEMLYRDDKFQQRKHNAPGDYTHSIGRNALRAEVAALFDAQRRLGNPQATAELERAFTDIFAWQLPFASGDLILSKVGSCTFLRDQKRAPKAAYTAERFNLFQRINNLSWYDGGEQIIPNAEQRESLVNRAHAKFALQYSDVRKLLDLPDSVRFRGVNYRSRPSKEGTSEPTDELAPEKKTNFCRLKAYEDIRKCATSAGVWGEISARPALLDEIAFALTFYKDEIEVEAYLRAQDCPPEFIAHPAKPVFRGVMHLSLKAMRKILPHMEAGAVYSDACALAGYDHSRPKAGRERRNKLPPINTDDVRNPVVLRALSQARKVVNAVVARYGPPTRVHVELARELGKGPEERHKIETQMEENRAANERRDREFEALFRRPPRNGDERLKWRLCREQQDQCAYSQHPLDVEHRFLEEGYLEIDHIIPYSKSFDDSMANKVLVLSGENQNKGNRTPFGYFGYDDARWARFEAWVYSTIRDPKKKNRLLSKTTPELDLEANWLPRNLVDTRYITREFSGFLRDNLQFADADEKLPVVCLNGFITAHLRRWWGLNKDRGPHKVREENDLHHAVDAAVIAAVTPGLIQRVTRYRQARETMRWKVGETYVDTETGEVVDFKFAFPLPWKGFRKEIMARLENGVTVSRMPQRGVSGPIHKETIKSARTEFPSGRTVRTEKLLPEEADGGKPVAVTRKALTDLKEADLDRLFATETNVKLYTAVRERMAAYGMDGKKAFAEPLRKPTNDGSEGALVKKVKLVEAQPTGVAVRSGVADNDSMARVDVFCKDGKHYLVPIYVADFMAEILPNRAIVAYKPEHEWTVIDGTFDFLFSLQPFDLVRVVTSKEEIFGYYRGCHRGTGAITLSMPNKTNELRTGIGVKTAASMEKYMMGVLGDYYKVTKETRRGVADGRNIQSGETEG